MMAVTGQQQQQTDVETSDFENDPCEEELNILITNSSERKHTLKTKRSTIAWYREELEILIEEEEEIENEVQNLTIQIQVIEDTCPGFLPLDCCQVGVNYTDSCESFSSFPLQIMIASNSLAETGLYEIKDPCPGDRKFSYAKIHVYCSMEIDGGGWIVIQRRIANGTVNFHKNWEDYVNGFGDLEGEFWIGLENMHELTNHQGVELQVTVWNDNETITWNYRTFRIGSAENNYALYVRGGNGDGDIDGLAYSNGCPFTTFDKYSSYSRCARLYQAGWWYYNYRYIDGNRKYCTDANLNGRHESSNIPDDSVARIHWATPGNTFSNTEMMIRSTTCGLSGNYQ